jgi:hypothetical protein
VFFWPGWSRGPVSSGMNHFERYRSERPVVLRVATGELFEANRRGEPLFCKYNSGAPRCSMGNGSPRGPTVFLNAAQFDASPSSVVEVTFRSAVILPPSVQAAGSLNGPWEPLKSFTSEDEQRTR